VKSDEEELCDSTLFLEEWEALALQLEMPTLKALADRAGKRNFAGSM
jgi:hypothetical protein